MSQQLQLLEDPDEIRPRRNRRRGNLLVAAELAILAACLIPIGPRWSGPAWLAAVGWVAAVFGAAVLGLGLACLGRAARIHPVPADGMRLCTRGVYSRLRHPLYAGVMLLVMGVALVGTQLLALPAAIALGVLLRRTARFEEDLLMQRFGWEYAAYACRVPAALPRVRRW